MCCMCSLGDCQKPEIPPCHFGLVLTSTIGQDQNTSCGNSIMLGRAFSDSEFRYASQKCQPLSKKCQPLRNCWVRNNCGEHWEWKSSGWRWFRIYKCAGWRTWIVWLTRSHDSQVLWLEHLTIALWCFEMLEFQCCFGMCYVAAEAIQSDYSKQFPGE